jgi:hypothetical protein
VLQPGVLQVSSGDAIAQPACGVEQLLAAAALAERLLELVAGFCISHQPLQIRPAHLLKPQMQPTWRALTRAARFPAAHWRILRHIEARWRSSPP